MEILARVAAELFGVPLFLEPRKAATIAAVLANRVGLDGDLAAFVRSAGPPLATRAPVRSRPANGYAKIGGGIAMVPVIGSLVTRAGGLDAESGLVSYDAVSGAVRAADADPDVTSILLDIHSPGGAATGAIECADVIHAVARKRPVVAVSNSLCASAAYMIAAAASQIVVTKTAVTGSIGVVMLHLDRSQQLADHGLVPTFIFAGKHKVDGNELQPLSTEVKSDLQREVDTHYKMFVDSVASHRPRLSVEALRSTEARTYLGAEAVEVGLADEVGTVETVMQDLAGFHKQAGSTWTKYDLIERTRGKIDASIERLKDAHAAGVRAGAAAALAERKS
ncbi:S49 family peptidase [Bradyrhizobium sp. CB82]|uniref:S49 family peptidase n=1 Tax=Bradyrhizobium sp. CB82 TaxID=3039159 RepID=UPI0024B1DB11|nr:S49 family peptidase [Bradyrhizobium sp. CB82]WFU44113.1 S49 family peptidase [Bradyrhizobium sp. CB82]